MGDKYSAMMAPLYKKIASYGRNTKAVVQVSTEERTAFLAIKEAAVEIKT